MFDSSDSNSLKIQSCTGVVIERRMINGSVLSKIIATDIYERLDYGNVAIVTKKPQAMLSAVRKQWLRQYRRAQCSRSATLDPNKRASIARDLLRYENATFTTEDPVNDPTASVSFATVQRFLVAPPIRATIFITSAIEKHELYMLTSWMPRGGKVIIYGRT